MFLVWAVSWVSYACYLFEEVRFEQRWPVLSDQEFLARCSPGVDPRVALGVRRIVAKQLGVAYERIHPDQSFVNDLGCD